VQGHFPFYGQTFFSFLLAFAGVFAMTVAVSGVTYFLIERPILRLVLER
jgi:peptidoglycan/LPS O-acetylase OafA/YrhL